MSSHKPQSRITAIRKLQERVNILSNRYLMFSDTEISIKCAYTFALAEINFMKDNEDSHSKIHMADLKQTKPKKVKHQFK